MAMVTCAECGGQLSTDAEMCPHCGAKKKKATSFFTWVVAWFFGIAFVVSLAGVGKNQPAKPVSPEEQAADAQKEMRFTKTAIAAAALKKSLRNPESIQWSSILANDDASTICLEYRAQNGFGGMNQEFALFHDGKPSQKPEDWNRHCAKKELWDMKSVRYALK